MLKDFDHYNAPLGADGTPHGYYERIRDWAIENDTHMGWSENYGGYWVVVSYEAAKQILNNPEVFSADPSTFPPFGSPSGRPLMMSAYDEPDHSKYRGLVNAAFSPKATARLVEPLRATANDMIDEFIEDGHVDAHDGLAKELPARAISAIMGLPPEEGDIYRTWTHAMANGMQTEPEIAVRHLEDMEKYFIDVLAKRRKDPGEDLISAIASAELDGRPLTENELLDFCFVFLLGGIDNTSKFIGGMLWRLGWDHDLRRTLIRRPQILPSVIEEGLRYFSPAMQVRTALEPITVCGTDIEVGQKVFMVSGIVNRDPREFENPDVFIPERTPNRHFGLGVGIHRCIGAHLLKVESRVAISEFLRRIPEYDLDPTRPTSWLLGQVGGMQSVPIVFKPGVRERSPEPVLQ